MPDRIPRDDFKKLIVNNLKSSKLLTVLPATLEIKTVIYDWVLSFLRNCVKKQRTAWGHEFFITK